MTGHLAGILVCLGIWAFIAWAVVEVCSTNKRNDNPKPAPLQRSHVRVVPAELPQQQKQP